MKLKFMILDKNINTSETNHNDTWEAIESKMDEEYLEFKEALKRANNKGNVGEELQDIIQVAIRGLVKLQKENWDIEQLNKRHNKKLVNRGWKHSKIIKIFVK